MEPTVVAALASKFIDLVLKTRKASDDWSLDGDDLQALRAALDTGATLIGKKKDTPVPPSIAHLTLVVLAFGKALRQHLRFHGLLGEDSHERKERKRQIELRIESVKLRVRDLGTAINDEVAIVEQLTGYPLGTPYYRVLWLAFSEPKATIENPESTTPLVVSGAARGDFERHFLLAYNEGIASPLGRGVKDYLEGISDYRTQRIRELLVADLATWGERHVFGNVAREDWNEGEAIPFLPLDEMYVEPLGAVVDKNGSMQAPEPLLALIDRLVAPGSARKVVVVTADFGSGKSLSARTAAQRWAAQFLHESSNSFDLALPIYVRCAEDFQNDQIDIPLTVQSAWLRQARTFQLSLSEEDVALTWPAGQRTICLLDGLDEVSMGAVQTKTLFKKLREKTGDKQRFVVFSRPGAVPSPNELGDEVITVKVWPLNEEQISLWLTNWNRLSSRPPITREALNAQALLDLASTPILLLMIAFTWDEASSEAPPSRAEIYERFFQQVANGKAETDHEQHGPIREASQQLRTTLQNAGVLDEQATLTDAMLWLMGLVAWEALRLEQQRPSKLLTQRHLDNLLSQGDFELPDSSVDLVRMGLVLALQADLRDANHVILFGHQSFREFLVARHWAGCLRRLVRGKDRAWDLMTQKLLGGRLLGGEDKSFDFLMQIINAPTKPHTPSLLTWTARDRQVLVDWAQVAFNDERQLFASGSRDFTQPSTEILLDLRAVLREAALAIGSFTDGSHGIKHANPIALRSMLAWFWLASIQPRLFAKNGNFAGADLARTSFWRANFKSSELTGADFSFTEILSSDFSDSCLQGSDFSRAHVSSIKLIGADLSRSDLSYSIFEDADFTDANLCGTQLSETNLSSTICVGVNLCEAQLYETNFTGSDLTHANFSRADLLGANFAEAILKDAVFEDAFLGGANFSGCDLSSCSLKGAKLRRLDIGLDIQYDEFTVWPADFDIETALLDESTWYPSTPTQSSPAAST